MSGPSSVNSFSFVTFSSHIITEKDPNFLLGSPFRISPVLFFKFRMNSEADVRSGSSMHGDSDNGDYSDCDYDEYNEGLLFLRRN